MENATDGGLFASPLFPMILMFVVIYFFMLRPKQKEMKETEKMQKALKKGDKVQTTGGILGTISEVEDATVTIKIADGTKIELIRDAVMKKIEKKSDTKASK